MPSGTVQLYKVSRGFGFIAPDDGSAALFVHVSSIDRSLRRQLKAGDRVTFTAGRDEEGRPAVVELALERSGDDPCGDAAKTSMTGRLRWFDAERGYGFIQPEAGGDDVFVHITSVKMLGVANLSEGQLIAYSLGIDPRTGKGSAVGLRLLG